MSSNDKNVLANFYQKNYSEKDNTFDSTSVANQHKTNDNNSESSSDEDFVCDTTDESTG